MFRLLECLKVWLGLGVNGMWEKNDSAGFSFNHFGCEAKETNRSLKATLNVCDACIHGD